MTTAVLRQSESVRRVRLTVSSGGQSPNERPGRGPAFAYLVRPGDSLVALARACGVPIAELMRRNPTICGNQLRAGDRIWIPDLLPALAGEPTEGLAQRAAQLGETRLSADRRHAAVLNSTVPNMPNNLIIYERKTGKKITVPLTAADQMWKRVGWSPEGWLIAIEGPTTGPLAEGGTLLAFDPVSQERISLLTPCQAAEDLKYEGYHPECVEIVSFRSVRGRLTYRLALRDDRSDHPFYADWSMASDGSERHRM